MSIIVLKLPEFKVTTGRPAQCPTCQGEILQRWGGQVKRVRDPSIDEVLVYRYRCCRCRSTFRHYPSGVAQAQQTQRLRVLAGLCWVLGLSYRGIAAVFAVFGVGISRMSAWRDAQERAKQLLAHVSFANRLFGYARWLVKHASRDQPAYCRLASRLAPVQ